MPNAAKRTSLQQDEGGAGTAWWIFWMIIFLIFGGLSVDSANAWRMRAELQYTADAAALAGIVELSTSQETTKTTAIAMAEKNMATDTHGNVLAESDVLLGIWNGIAFVENEITPNAVKTITRRDETNSNRLKTYFLRLVGMDSWNVSALATAAIHYPECLQTNTIYAGGIVDFKSVHNFYSPVCIHGEEGVKVRNQNLWGTEGAGTLVDISVGEGMELWMPESDPETHNPYIQWHEEPLPKKITEYLGDILGSFSDGLQSLEDTEYDEYMEGLVLPGTVTAEELTPPLTILKDEWDVDVATNTGQIYNVDCVESVDDPDWNTLNVFNTETITETVLQEVINDDGSTSMEEVTVTTEVALPYTLENVVLVTNCNIKFGSNNLLQDVVIGSTAGLYGAKPQHNILHFGADNQLGKPGDGCDPDGNVTFISTASIKMAAGSNINGAQFLATHDMHISAGTEAAMDFQFTAGNDVFFAANSDFGDASVICGDEDLLEFAYFRLVE